ncbi:MAG TPA: PilZ domain-containing protein, partial [Bradyrhizobium sp.]|nr:PilZ domain-containing protein [Bradyrhizobium sp.]
TQRALASYWDQLAAGRAFPAFTEFNPEASGHDPKQLVVWNIEGAGRLLKFRALYQGENVAEVFNSRWAGKTMEQVVPMSLRRITLDAARECAASGCLIYAIFSTVDANDQRIDCERLLLPFGRDGKVEQLLGSLQLKGSQGGVRRTKVLGDFQLQADVVFSGKIASGFTRASGVDSATGVSNDTSAVSSQAGGASGEHRSIPRRNTKRAARISFDRENLTCTVRNISATGAALEGTNLARTPDHFVLVMEMESSARSCKVVWRNKSQIGVQFS